MSGDREKSVTPRLARLPLDQEIIGSIALSLMLSGCLLQTHQKGIRLFVGEIVFTIHNHSCAELVESDLMLPSLITSEVCPDQEDCRCNKSGSGLPLMLCTYGRQNVARHPFAEINLPRKSNISCLHLAIR